MIKCEIEKVEDYNYTIRDLDNEMHILNMDFYGLLKKPSIGDYLYIKEELLNSQIPLYFEVMPSLNKEAFLRLNEKEFLLLVIENQEYYLKRVYG